MVEQITKELGNELKILFTLDRGHDAFTTSIIEDKNLDAVIIDSKEKVSIIIKSSLGYDILNVAEHSGVKYYAPRAIEQQPKANLINNDCFTKFHLNEPLEFILHGPKDAEIKVILRFS